jgi:methionine-rich copper-binding protein CopC
VQLRSARTGVGGRVGRLNVGAEPDVGAVLMPGRLRGSGIAAVAAVALLVVVVAAGWTTRRPAPMVVASSPADGSTLARGPTGIELSFGGPVDPDRSHVDVRDAAGASANTAPPALVAADRIRQPVRIVARGAVTVTYHATLLDGGQVTGTLSFTVGDARPGAGPADAAGHEHGIDPFSAALLVADGAVVLAVAILLARRPRRA